MAKPGLYMLARYWMTKSKIEEVWLKEAKRGLLRVVVNSQKMLNCMQRTMAVDLQVEEKRCMVEEKHDKVEEKKPSWFWKEELVAKRMASEIAEMIEPVAVLVAELVAEPV